MLKLVIANKLYSSWSLRPWMVLSAFNIPFEEIVIPLRVPESRGRILEFSPTGKVPALIDGEVSVWESLAIIEYLAEAFPDRAIWPRDGKARAHARSIANEMHAGFMPLRQTCPMHLGARFATPPLTEALKASIDRVEDIWSEARNRFPGGPFLYGAFSAADAMYVPVVTRFETFQIPVREATRVVHGCGPCTPVFPRLARGGARRAVDHSRICRRSYSDRKLHLKRETNPMAESQTQSHYPSPGRVQELVSRTLSIVVDNEPGVLARVIGLFAGRGYNINSLTVTEVEHERHLSRITVITSGTPAVMQQIKHQLERLVPVHRVRDLTQEGGSIERELALIKVGGKGDKRIEALRLAEIFRAKVVDTSIEHFVFEVTGKPSKIESFIQLMTELGLVEVSRTGIAAIGRGVAM